MRGRGGIKMSITTVCRDCGETFRKRSLKSIEKICEACRGSGERNRYKDRANKNVNESKMVDDKEKQIEE